MELWGKGWKWGLDSVFAGAGMGGFCKIPKPGLSIGDAESQPALVSEMGMLRQQLLSAVKHPNRFPTAGGFTILACARCEKKTVLRDFCAGPTDSLQRRGIHRAVEVLGLQVMT